MITILKTEDLPSTNNPWGFGGASNKKRYTMSNGDIWVSGVANHRHLPDLRYIQAIFKKGVRWKENWSGGLSNDLDNELRMNPIKYINAFYKKLENDLEKIQKIV